MDDPRATPFSRLYTRDNNFDALRLVLALFVLVSHCYPLTGKAAREPLYAFSRAQTTAGTVAVDFFFVISGFLVSSSFVRSSSVADYAKKRFLRIYPGYWVATAFSLALVLLAGAAPPGSLHAATLSLRFADPGPFPCNLCFGSNPFPGVVNQPLWSLLYETRCYVFVVLAGALGCFTTRRWLLGALSAISLVTSFAIELGYWILPRASAPAALFTAPLTHWPELFPFFCFGSLLSVVAHEGLRFSTSWAAVCAIVLVVLARLGRGFETGLVVFGSYLVLWFAAHPKIRLHRFAEWGDLSYGVYLFAFPIQQLIVRLAPGIAPLALAAAGAACTLPVAALSWHVVEKRALRLARGRARAGPAVREGA